MRAPCGGCATRRFNIQPTCPHAPTPLTQDPRRSRPRETKGSWSPPRATGAVAGSLASDSRKLGGESLRTNRLCSCPRNRVARVRSVRIGSRHPTVDFSIPLVGILQTAGWRRRYDPDDLQDVPSALSETVDAVRCRRSCGQDSRSTGPSSTPPRRLARIDPAGLGRRPLALPPLLRPPAAHRRRRDRGRNSRCPLAPGPGPAPRTAYCPRSAPAGGRRPRRCRLRRTPRARPAGPIARSAVSTTPRRADPVPRRGDGAGRGLRPNGLRAAPPPKVAPADAGQGELFSDDYAQPDSADAEPVFWCAGSGQASPDDDFVQADAAETL